MPRRTGRWILAAVAASAAAAQVVRAAGWIGGVPLAPPIEVTRAYVEFADTLRARETIADVLGRAGLSGREQVALLTAATTLDPRRLRAGQVVHLRRPVHQRVADRVMVRLSPEVRVAVRRAGGDSGWIQTAERIAWAPTVMVATGTITRTLYDALDSAIADTTLPRGERVALAWAIADVYDWEIDFTRDTRSGDRVRVVFERLESAEGERRFGRVLAARVEVASTPSYAYWFEPDSGKGGFYDDQGRSLRRAFLRVPLEFRRISSRFGGRYHPIRRTWRKHQGTDYAADAGTPVRATADGSVVKAGYAGGLGLMVELRHANGIRTRYGHLSRLGAGIRPGGPRRPAPDRRAGRVHGPLHRTAPALRVPGERPAHEPAAPRCRHRQGSSPGMARALRRDARRSARHPRSAASPSRRYAGLERRRAPGPAGRLTAQRCIRGSLSRHRRARRARRARPRGRRPDRRGAGLRGCRGALGALCGPRSRVRHRAQR
jgi:murein DD-endopeptidase MepM/ murein hydrolase activator NlpD